MFLTYTYTPTSILEEFIDCFYFNKSNQKEYYGYSFPTVNQELFLNLGDRFELYNEINGPIKGRSWISGAQSKMSSVFINGEHITTGVIFKPWGLYQAFGINAKEIFNKNIGIKSFFNNWDDLRNTEPNPEQLFDYIECVLIKSLKQKKLPVTMNSVIKDLEREDLNTLSFKLKRSKKSIIESFNKIVGISPYKYYHLISVCESISALKSKPDVKLTELAYELGFYDQSHFIKIFKEHTGYSPKNFKSEFLKES